MTEVLSNLHNSIVQTHNAKKLYFFLNRLSRLNSNINFNTSKCKALTISRRKQPIVLNYHLGSAELIRVDSEVDPGITVTSNLSWNRHITKLVTKANSTLGLLRRTCPMLTNCDARRTLYLSLVKSQLSYATEIWSPHQSLITKLGWRNYKDAPRDGSSKRRKVTLYTKIDCWPSTYYR